MTQPTPAPWFITNGRNLEYIEQIKICANEYGVIAVINIDSDADKDQCIANARRIIEAVNSFKEAE